MAIYIGNNKMINRYVGNNKVIRVYQGTDIAYDASSSGGETDYGNITFRWDSTLSNEVMYSINGVSTVADTSNSTLYSTNTYEYVKEMEESLTTCYNMFLGCAGITSIMSLPKFNTTTSCMFQGCTNLTYIYFPTGCSATAASYMFNGCTNLREFSQLAMLDVSRCQNMSYMFQNCASLPSLTITTWNMSNVTSMNNMFYGCSSLEHVHLPWNTSKTPHPIGMSAMFRNCSKLLDIDVSNIVNSNTNSISQLFLNCESLTSVTANNWDVSNVTSYSDMFVNCNALTTLNIGEVSQTTYDWWVARLTECGIVSNVTINATIV